MVAAMVSSPDGNVFFRPPLHHSSMFFRTAIPFGNAMTGTRAVGVGAKIECPLVVALNNQLAMSFMDTVASGTYLLDPHLSENVGLLREQRFYAQAAHFSQT